ncbi:hypothetical protein EJB05_00790, partial [Eragrostis curvula]
MDAKADGAVLTGEVSGLVQSELHVVGKAEFVLEGEVTGLGYLHCKVFLFSGKATDESKAVGGDGTEEIEEGCLRADLKMAQK